MNEALGLLEVTGLTPTLVAVDIMEKTADVRVIQCELNDFYGVSTKIAGSVEAVHAAMAAGVAAAERMGGNPVASILDRADEEAQKAIFSPKEYNPLIEQDVVFFANQDNTRDIHDVGVAVELPPQPRGENGTVHLIPTENTISSMNKEHAMEQENFALGLIETQGFTAVFEAIDTACKTANVQVVCKEKLGGGYITIIIKGELSAVKAAVDAGQAKVEGLGKLIASHVIARPSKAVLSLLPKS